MNKIIIYFFTLFLVIFTCANIGHALSCAFTGDKYIVICQSGRCERGFWVSNEPTGSWCETRQKVYEYPDYDTAGHNSITNKLKFNGLDTGIYEIDFREGCLMGRYAAKEEPLSNDEKHYYLTISNRCFGQEALSISRLTEDTTNSALKSYLTQWKSKEKIAYTKMTVGKWFGAILILFIGIIVAGGPYLLFLKKAAYKKISHLWFICIIPSQLILIVIMYPYLSWSYYLWRMLWLIVSVLLLIAVLGELLLLLMFLIKNKSVKDVVYKSNYHKPLQTNYLL